MNLATTVDIPRFQEQRIWRSYGGHDERTERMRSPGFGEVITEHMVTVRWTEEKGWHDGRPGNHCSTSSTGGRGFVQVDHPVDGAGSERDSGSADELKMTWDRTS